MAYEGSTAQPYSTADWSSGIARSQDTVNWFKYSGNPVVPQTNQSFGDDGPEMIQINGYTYLYVRAYNPGGGMDRYRLDWN
jgi:hypothetical protein